MAARCVRGRRSGGGVDGQPGGGARWVRHDLSERGRKGGRKASVSMKSVASALSERASGVQRDPYSVPVLPPPAALLEIVVLCGGILLVDWLFTSIDVSELQPNPYWVPVLLLSLQYGAVSGMIAAAFASIATIYSGFPEQGVGENYFVYFMRVWALPIVWLGVAIVVGQFRTRQIATKQALRRQLDELSTQRAALAEHAVNLRRRCEALERDIAGREDRVSAPGLIDAVSALASRAQPFEEAFTRLAAAALPDAYVVLYQRNGDAFEILAETVPMPGLLPKRRLEALDGLVDALARARRLSVLDAEGERALAGNGIAAVRVGPAREAGMDRFLLIVAAPGQLIRAELVERLDVVGAFVAGALDARARSEEAPIALEVSEPRRPWRQRRWLPARRSGSKRDVVGGVTGGSLRRALDMSARETGSEPGSRA